MFLSAKAETHALSILLQTKPLKPSHRRYLPLSVCAGRSRCLSTFIIPVLTCCYSSLTLGRSTGIPPYVALAKCRCAVQTERSRVCHLRAQHSTTVNAPLALTQHHWVGDSPETSQGKEPGSGCALRFNVCEEVSRRFNSQSNQLVLILKVFAFVKLKNTVWQHVYKV